MRTKTRKPARKPSRAVAHKKFAASLGELEHAELVRAAASTDQEFIFKHALIQDTAYASLTRHERKRLHQLVGEAYEAIYADRCLDEYAALLAQHFAETDDAEKTIAYATRAGNIAAGVYANAEALAYYSQAIALAGQMGVDSTQLQQLYLARGRVLELMGKHPQALKNYVEMETLAHTRGDAALELAALMAQTTILATPNTQFDPMRAQICSERALALAQTLYDHAAQAKILWNIMLLYHFSGRTREAVAYGEQAIALARQYNLREQLAYALNDIGRVYLVNQDFDRALPALEQAQASWRALDNQPMQADNLNTLATTLINTGEHERGRALAAEAFAIGQRIHNPWTMAHSRMTLAASFSESGEIADALSAMHECLGLAQQASFQIAILNMKNLLALTYAMLGDLPRAMQCTNVDVETNPQALVWQSNLSGMRAQLFIWQGDLEQARALIDLTTQATSPLELNPFANNLNIMAEIELALAEHDASQLNALESQLQFILEKGRFPGFQLAAQRLLARLLLAQQRVDEALRVLEEAHTLAERTGSRRQLWQILALLAEIETQRGNTTLATEYYAQAYALLEYIRAHVPDEYRASFWQTDAVQQIVRNVNTREKNF